MNKDINKTLMALVPILRMNGENVTNIEAVHDWYKAGDREYMKEVAEITYDNGTVRYADIGCDSNLTAIYDVIAVIQQIKPKSEAIERIERGVYSLPPAQPEPCEDAVSRQAAIDAIKDRYYKYGRFAKIEELVWSIEKLPPAQPEPCEDAVSRKDCLQALSHLMDVEGFRSGWAVSRANVECMLKAMPSVTPKQGKWIRNGWAITCSECGYDMPYTVRNFCPNCGAKMTKGVAE